MKEQRLRLSQKSQEGNTMVNRQDNPEETYDTVLTAAEIEEMAKAGGRLEGHWAITIFFPSETSPFTTNRVWVDLLNTLTESCGVKITTLKFKLNPQVISYEFGMKED
jgi:hypothetical protein